MENKSLSASEPKPLNFILPERCPRLQMTEASLLFAIENLELLPIMKSSEYKQIDDPDTVEFSFDAGVAVQLSNISEERLQSNGDVNRWPKFRIKVDQQGREALQSVTAIYGSGGHLSQNYTYNMNQNGEVKAHLFRILAADKPVGIMSDGLLEKLYAKAAQLIVDRDRTYAPLFLAEQAKVVARAWGTTTQEQVKNQMKTLWVEGDRIYLPEEVLSQYMEIKKLVMRAGGTYASNASGSYFIFPNGIDPVDVLQALMTGERVNIKKETQFFATSQELGLKAIEKFGDVTGKDFLEPSAGDGALADIVKSKGGSVTTIENWRVNILALAAKGYTPLERDFLTVSPDEIDPVDYVLMNPPFSNRQDIAHVSHALGFLKPKGELCAIMSPAFQAGGSSKSLKKFGELVQLADATVENIEDGAFKKSGTDAKTVMVHIKMQSLLTALRERNETGEEYGLDLSSILARQGAMARP